MGYIEASLNPGEQVIYRARLHWITFIGPIFWLLVWIGVWIAAINLLSGRLPSTNYGILAYQSLNIVILLIVLGAFLRVLGGVISFLTSEFAITDKRVLAKLGSIRRQSVELFLSKVEGILVDEGVLGRLFGYGTITVTGTGGTKTPFKDIANPYELRKQVQTHVLA